MKDNVFIAALAGLLYPIGRFARRAGIDGDNFWPAIIPQQWQQASPPEIAGQRHLEQIINLAARLAVGTEPEVTGQPSGQLLSIFCNLRLAEALQPPVPAYLPLHALRINEDTIFPQEAANQADVRTAYQSLWHGSGSSPGFFAQATALKAVHDKVENKEAYLNSLLKLLERYCWAIPAARYDGRADISLYNQSRITAALAACLVNHYQDDMAGGEVALLVGGDISGVQNFIYTITSRGAASALRGRSMYLQLLTDIVTRYILQEIGMPLTNVIYAGGGHFYLLAPFSGRQIIEQAQKDISRILLHHHQGDLYLAVAQEPLLVDHFKGDALSDRWKALTKKLQAQKQRRFSELGSDMADRLFKPLEHGGNLEKLCVVCNCEHPATTVIETDEPEIRKCPPCVGFEELGKDLREARYLCLETVGRSSLPNQDDPAGDWRTICRHFGYQITLSERLLPVNPTAAYREVMALTDDAINQLQPKANQAVGRRFLVNVTPLLTEAEYHKLKDKVDDLPQKFNPKDLPVKPFEAMARQARGIKRLGVLRMDVDNLGQIFSTGLGEQANLARIAALSFSVSLFFEGWVEHIAETINRQQNENLIYSIYSGGDDLFFVGAWHLLPALAETISADLKRYAAGHAGVHLSGGLALVTAKYPLYQAADEAHRAEQAAKSTRPDGSRKNALNFLQQTIPWPRYAEIKAMHQTLVGLVQSSDEAQKGTPKSLIRLLIQFYAQYEKDQQERARNAGAKGRAGQAQMYWGRGQWLSAYSLTRLARRIGRDNKTAGEQIMDIYDRLRLENFTNIEWIGLAARWAELLIRKDTDN